MTNVSQPCNSTTILLLHTSKHTVENTKNQSATIPARLPENFTFNANTDTEARILPESNTRPQILHRRHQKRTTDKHRRARARTIQRRKQLAKIITSLAAPDLRLSKSRKSNWIKSLLAPTPDLQHSAFFLPSTQLINNLSSFPTPDATKKKIPPKKNKKSTSETREPKPQLNQQSTQRQRKKILSTKVM